MKKIITILLTGAMLLGICGCEKKEEVKTNGEVPVITWYVGGDTESGLPDVMDAMNEILVEKIGAKLDLQVIDSGAYNEKIKLAMSSGDAFDLCYLDPNLFNDAVSKGGVLAMDDYLKDSILSKEIPEEIMTFGQFEDSIYAIPNVQILAYTPSLFIQTHLMEEFGLDVNSINSIEDVEPFLEWVKTNKPEYYPIRFADGGTEVMEAYSDTLYDSFSGEISAYEDENGEVKVIKNIDKEGYWEFQELKNDWFKKGYIRSDIATIGTNDWDDVNMGKYAIFTSGYKPGGVEGVNARFPDLHYTEAIMAKPYMKYDAGCGTMTAIGRNSKNPELVFKFLELINTDKELYNLITFGVEGKHYEKLDNGKIKIIAEGGYAANAGWKFGNQYNAYVLDNQPDDVWTKTEEWNNAAKKSKLIGFKVDTSKVKIELTQVSTVKSKYSSLDKGYKEVSSYKEEYIKELETAGIDKILEEYQRQVDEWLKTK